MAKIIPDYSAAKTEVERVRLEKRVSTLLRYVTLPEAEKDYHVDVSEKEGIVYLKPKDAFSQIKNGSLSITSHGDNVTSIDKIVTKAQHGGIELSHTKEVTINGQTFILTNYSRLSA